MNEIQVASSIRGNTDNQVTMRNWSGFLTDKHANKIMLICGEERIEVAWMLVNA